MNNIAVFGLVHSGKSTMIGYIKSKIDNITPICDDPNDPDKFARIVSNHIDELKQTKQKHFLGIKDSEPKMTFIDTPGSIHPSKSIENKSPIHSDTERDIGMSYGNIGIFFIDMQYAASDEIQYNQEFALNILSPLIVWLNFKKKLVICLSKSDIVSYSQILYLKAKDNLYKICGKINAPIIPISINVKQEIDENVITKSKLMNWNEKTLFEILQDFCEDTTKKIHQDPLIVHVSKQYQKKLIPDGIGKTWTCKVIQNKLLSDKKIKISPAFIENENEYKTFIAEIKSMKNIYSEFIEEAEEGMIIGLNLKDIRDENDNKYNKSELMTNKTSLIFSENAKVHLGNKVNFEFKDLDPNLKVGTQLTIMWFGRSIAVEIIGLDKNIVSMSLLGNNKIAMEFRQDYIIKKFFLVDKTKDKESRKYYQVTLSRIFD